MSLAQPNGEGKESSTDQFLAHLTVEKTLAAMPNLGWKVLAHTISPIRGAKSGKRKKGAGNLEFLALLKPLSTG